MGTNLYFLHAVSPIHVGVGEGVGAVNLPIARERMTGYPYLPGSSVKGVLRDAAERAAGADDPDVLTAFGPPTERAADARGGLVFSDASILCLPVRSLFGTFAWVTSPWVLSRLERDAKEAGLSVPGTETFGLEGDETWVAADTALTEPRDERDAPTDSGVTLYLEDLRLTCVREDASVGKCADWLAGQLWPDPPATNGSAAGALAQRTRDFFRRRFLVVQGQLFDFLTRTAIEVRTRVKIDDDRGTAAASGPWQEEALPAETVLHGLVIARPTKVFRIARDAQRRMLPPNPDDAGEDRTAAQAWAGFHRLVRSGSPVLRFGGKSSVGMGRARLQVAS